MTGTPPPERRRRSLWTSRKKKAATEAEALAVAAPDPSALGTTDPDPAAGSLPVAAPDHISAARELADADVAERTESAARAGASTRAGTASAVLPEDAAALVATATRESVVGTGPLPTVVRSAAADSVKTAPSRATPDAPASDSRGSSAPAPGLDLHDSLPSPALDGPGLTAPTEPAPAEPNPPPSEPLPSAPISPAPHSPAPGGPEPAPSEPLPAAPISPAPHSPAPAGPEPFAPTEPVPDMPVSPGPVGPAVPEMPDGPLADLPPMEPAGGSVADEVSAELAAQATDPVAQPAPRKAEPGEWRGIVLVTGTDTDVGKTIVTAAIAASAQASGLRVAVIKPGQTGTADGGPTDIDLVNRLAAPHTARTLASFPEPLAPLAAARVANLAPLELYEVVDAVRAESARHDLVLVEGAGGLLVPMGVRPSGEPWTLADLATTLGVSTIVVSRAGLGTLNHTALTLEALARRGVPVGVVLGAWPTEPELVHWANFSELLPHLVGALPDGAGAMEPGVFRRSAPGWLIPALYGVLDDWRVWAEEVS
jgi:dethiobiotin synthetase